MSTTQSKPPKGLEQVATHLSNVTSSLVMPLHKLDWQMRSGLVMTAGRRPQH